MLNKNKLIVIGGATAVGKTSLAIALAKALSCEIISADSRQFYREMHIGTAKPSIEELQMATHHFIGHVSIHQTYNVADYRKDATRKIEELFTQYPYVILVGGSGLYIKAVTDGLHDFPTDINTRLKYEKLYKQYGIEFLQNILPLSDKTYFNLSDINNPVRLIRALEIYELTGQAYSEHIKREKLNDKEKNYETVPLFLQMERTKLYSRINARVDKMMEIGLLDEVKELYPYKELPPLNTVGYKELFEYLDNKTTLSDAIERIKQHTRNYAKRQITWFKKQNFLPVQYDDLSEALRIIKRAERK